MKTVFADAFYFFALLNKKDTDHAKSVTWTKTYTGKIVTSEWVLTELADGLASSRNRSVFDATRQRMLADPSYKVVPLSMDLYEDGVKLYVARADKDWPLTDCISFVIMQREGLTDALTGDHHFEQAGFKPVLK
jgi:predicted nucleic acid-binding protein